MIRLLKLFASPALQHEVALKRVYRDDMFHHKHMEEALAKVDADFNVYPILMYASWVSRSIPTPTAVNSISFGSPHVRCTPP